LIISANQRVKCKSITFDMISRSNPDFEEVRDLPGPGIMMDGGRW
jgi:hypothetical protein